TDSMPGAAVTPSGTPSATTEINTETLAGLESALNGLKAACQ
ncbi:Clp protease ClpP, partial [Yersinia enterocolitica]|nr:Clp protease ClpP [Yersinia enterocolitica]EKN6394843.1 Clp protease ClpP [Yersinia enterocolitica]